RTTRPAAPAWSGQPRAVRAEPDTRTPVRPGSYPPFSHLDAADLSAQPRSGNAAQCIRTRLIGCAPAGRTGYGGGVPAPARRETTTIDLMGELPFPEPAAVLSLRHCTVYRAADDDNQPILIVTDGVTTLALECGLQGVSAGVIEAAERLADAVHDYATS